MRDPRLSGVVGAVIGVFYLVTGAWAYLAPLSFFSAVATFAPLNIHLLHDAGAFQLGLGLALTVPVALRAPLRAPLIAVLGASVPTTDLPVLTLICVALAAALIVDLRAGKA